MADDRPTTIRAAAEPDAARIADLMTQPWPRRRSGGCRRGQRQ